MSTTYSTTRVPQTFAPVDIPNPCGPRGYAVRPKISNTLNEATRKCYGFGGKDCVIRAWACDANG
jgi:hypothetical protein